MRQPRLNKIEHRRPKLRGRRFHPLTRGRRAGKSEDARPDNRADAERGEVERGKGALHEPLGRFRFAN